MNNTQNIHRCKEHFAKTIETLKGKKVYNSSL